MRGDTNVLGVFEKIEGARLSGGLLQRGVSKARGSNFRITPSDRGWLLQATSWL